MLRAYVVVLAALLAASACEGAVLLRFINTVPTRLSTNPNGATPAPTANGHVGSPSWTQDRVGLQYFADSTATGSVQSATLVWTELLNQNANEGLPDYAPHAWSHGMPALRAYHSTNVPATGLVDRVAAYLAAQIPGGLQPWSEDNYEQTFLKADGVSLYLSFAPGTYRMQAYGVLGSLADPLVLPYANTIRPFTGSAATYTFEDNKVYTLVAIGDGRWSATPIPITGNTVVLRLFEESTAPTMFGMAAVRWFHAIKSYSSDTISVFRGDASSAPAIVSGIAFGALSDYVNVRPSSSQVFPITTSSTGTTVVAPVSSDRTEVTHDIRAGLRATVICAVNNDVDNRVFCRMIPSRVVAYVRLVNDLAGLTSITQSRFGSQPFNRVNLTLMASYEFPRPDQVFELSQTGGSRSANNHPANTRGLYGVVSNVGPNSCSGYGEVFVPLLIMDFAIRFTIIRDSPTDNVNVGEVATGAVGGYTGALDNNQIRPANGGANNQWFIGAPVFKRVHFVLKTDGMSTVSGLGTSNGPNPVSRVYAAGLGDWFTNALLLDEYMEPGAFYSLFVTPANNGGATPTPANTLVNPVDVRFFWRLDRTIDVVSSGIAAGKATISYIPFGDQNWNGAQITLRPRTSTNGNQVTTITNNALLPFVRAAGTAAAPINANAEWATTPAALTADADSYTFDYSLATIGNPCDNQIPGSTAVTFAAGDVVDVYVLNSAGCRANSNDANRLQVTVCKTQSAIDTNNAVNTLLNGVSPTPSTNFFAAAPAVSASLSFVMVAIFAAVAALL